MSRSSTASAVLLLVAAGCGEFPWLADGRYAVETELTGYTCSEPTPVWSESEAAWLCPLGSITVGEVLRSDLLAEPPACPDVLALGERTWDVERWDGDYYLVDLDTDLELEGFIDGDELEAEGDQLIETALGDDWMDWEVWLWRDDGAVVGDLTVELLDIVLGDRCFADYQLRLVAD